MQRIDTNLVIVIFDPWVPLLHFEYIRKRTFLEVKILGVFISHLGLHTSKISSKSVT
jgi:hypothetical protein